MTLDQILLRKENRELTEQIVTLQEQISELEQDVLVLQHIVDVKKTQPQLGLVPDAVNETIGVPAIGFTYDYPDPNPHIDSQDYTVATDFYITNNDLGVDSFWSW
jgi:hypothetical protein